ncbi:MAG: hypothetical protein HP003_01850 [Oscillospiraceae bacterium]|nr:hypothetical protein [Oscillospiraceae bacterium]
MTVQVKCDIIIFNLKKCKSSVVTQRDIRAKLNRTAFLNGIFQFFFGHDYRNIILRKHGHRQQCGAEAEDQEEGQETFFHGVFPFRRQILSASRQNSGISRWVVDGVCAIVTCRWEKGKDFGKFIFAGKKASPSRGGGSA